ncbi:CRISPR-associated endonuclease Cas1 [Ignavibacteria bacterium 4137-Me]
MKNILILTAQSTCISQKGKRIIINTNEAQQEIKIKDISSCIFFGNIQFTTQALRLFAKEGIQVTNLSYEGEPRYIILPAYHINYDLRIRQYEAYFSEELRFKIARFIVSEKIRLSYEFISRNKSRHKKFSIRNLSKEFNKTKEKIMKAENVDELLGLEGNFSKIYFNYLKELSKGKIRFIERSKRPPRDEANAS